MARTPAPEQPTPPVRRNRVDAVARDAGATAAGAFARMGFTDPTLVLRWTDIAGAELARLCQPLKLNGEILTLKALPGAALFLAHEKRALMERINAYLGRPAVSQIRFVQGGITVRPAALPPPKPGDLLPADPARRFAGPEKLGEALARLARWRGQD
jgi:hypothetical protein